MNKERNWAFGWGQKNNGHSKFTRQEKTHSQSKSENVMHHKEQNQQSDYYKKLEKSLNTMTRWFSLARPTQKPSYLIPWRTINTSQRWKLKFGKLIKWPRTNSRPLSKQHFSKVWSLFESAQMKQIRLLVLFLTMAGTSLYRHKRISFSSHPKLWWRAHSHYTTGSLLSAR